ncbi:MAG TPA: zinc-binding alcohol dehydrogenase [Polyangiaceae bacterium]|jgi:2-desacetyl-2-hydroxyethyl bacteriochlorophyllide A dehydrogenase|nr:zinc-binding alcohol dehydrogenase [Polyangiaceae bacterium]
MANGARAFWITGVGTGAIRDEPLSEPGPGEVLVETTHSGVSRGTESLVFGGRVPPSEYQRMRCPFQAGEFPAPVKYGYQNVGRARNGAFAGRAVFCLFPHQTAYVVAESALVPVPDGVPAERAVLAANMETALNALWDAAPRAGDRVSVVGAGVLGCLVAHLVARIPGTEVELVDVSEARRAVAGTLGVSFSTPSDARKERDLVFHASGRGEGALTALGLAATESTVVELSWFGDAEVSLPLGRDFHVRRLTLRSSQVGRVSPNARPRFTHRARLELALSLLADPRLDALIDREIGFEDLPGALPRLASEGGLCTRVRY